MEILCYMDSYAAARPVPSLKRIIASFRNFGVSVNMGRVYSVLNNEIPRSMRLPKIDWSGIFAARKALLFASLVVAAGWFCGLGLFSLQHIAAKLFAVPLTNPLAYELESLDTAMIRFVLPRDQEVDQTGMLLNTAPLPLMPYTQPVTYKTYTVKTGETISSIARQFGLTNISTLISVNDIQNVRQLRAGQELVVPSTDGIFYRIKQGDSIAGISAKNNIAVEDILDVNDLDTTEIIAGAKLFLPGVHLDSETLKKSMGELFAMPLTVGWRLSSPFGIRPDPFTGVRSQHTGIDMAVAAGTPILAAMSGTIVVSAYSNIYGNYVIINHGNGYQTLYGHMQKILVQKGQTVNQGTRIGLVGSTGYSTGPHLHFSVYKNGRLNDPARVLKK
jgi:murein DD-endopeptidase MepM/ murein hydrolase activator NlpD